MVENWKPSNDTLTSKRGNNKMSSNTPYNLNYATSDNSSQIYVPFDEYGLFNDKVYQHMKIIKSEDQSHIIIYNCYDDEAGNEPETLFMLLVRKDGYYESCLHMNITVNELETSDHFDEYVDVKVAPVISGDNLKIAFVIKDDAKVFYIKVDIINENGIYDILSIEYGQFAYDPTTIKSEMITNVDSLYKFNKNGSILYEIKSFFNKIRIYEHTFSNKKVTTKMTINYEYDNNNGLALYDAVFDQKYRNLYLISYNSLTNNITLFGFNVKINSIVNNYVYSKYELIKDQNVPIRNMYPHIVTTNMSVTKHGRYIGIEIIFLVDNKLERFLAVRKYICELTHHYGFGLRFPYISRKLKGVTNIGVRYDEYDMIKTET